MGFFTEDKIAGHCAYCGADIVEQFSNNSDKLIRRKGYKTLDGVFLCPECLKQKAVDPRTIEKMTSDAVYSEMSGRHVLSPREFTPDKRVIPKGGYYPYMEIDSTRKMINVPEFKIHLFSYDECIDHPLHFSEIIDVQLIDNGEQVVEGGSLLNAVIGGLFGGGAGAIVGSQTNSRRIIVVCTELRIKIVSSNIRNNPVFIDLIHGNCKRDSNVYRKQMDTAQEILSILTAIISENKKNAAPARSQSVANAETFDFADAIRKLSELHDAGLLTDAEFANKKADILARL
jgi:hypothetical protein